MMQVESVFFTLAESLNQDVLVICDRGAMDASACKPLHPQLPPPPLHSIVAVVVVKFQCIVIRKVNLVQLLLVFPSPCHTHNL
jgi:hypothetical protein